MSVPGPRRPVRAGGGVRSRFASAILLEHDVRRYNLQYHRHLLSAEEMNVSMMTYRRDFRELCTPRRLDSYLSAIEEVSELSRAFHISTNDRDRGRSVRTCASQIGSKFGFSQLTPNSNCSKCTQRQNRERRALRTYPEDGHLAERT